ncbi:hypothetical protein ACSV5K_07390 [Agrobacterium pusense]|uniref:hypothetical protein n=1 Tax=Agrobacterium pusense TaxID=648995 RepID=UPI003FD22FAD
MVNGVAAAIAAYARYAEANGGPPAKDYAEYLLYESAKIPENPKTKVPGNLRIEAILFDTIAKWILSEPPRPGSHLRLVPEEPSDD